jgi:sulfate adenylyltransferase subunit 2
MIMWSTGKDSTTLLHLIKSALGEIPYPVVYINTHRHFAEIYEFRDKIAKLWDLDLKVLSSSELVDPLTDKLHCCRTLKIDPLKQLIQDEHYDAIFVSIRRDEHGVRMKDRYFSPRTEDFKWQFSKEQNGKVESLQDVELSGWGLFFSDYGSDCSHVRIHPLLHWNEIDIWRYIKAHEVPVNRLYYSQNGMRYRSLGCTTCTSPVESNACTIDEIIKELETTTVAERSGRAQDKEAQHAMEYLRMMGYY